MSAEKQQTLNKLELEGRISMNCIVERNRTEHGVWTSVGSVVSHAGLVIVCVCVCVLKVHNKKLCHQFVGFSKKSAILFWFTCPPGILFFSWSFSAPPLKAWWPAWFGSAAEATEWNHEREYSNNSWSKFNMNAKVWLVSPMAQTTWFRDLVNAMSQLLKETFLKFGTNIHFNCSTNWWSKVEATIILQLMHSCEPNLSHGGKLFKFATNWNSFYGF